MSHWLLKNIQKRHLLLLKLAGLVFLLHCIVLLWIFFIHNNAFHAVALTLNKHIDYNAPILFVPLHQKISESVIPQNSKKSDASADSKPVATQSKTTITKATKKPESQKENKKIENTTPKIPEKKSVTPNTSETSAQKTTPQASPQIKKQDKPVIPAHAHVSHNYKEVEALRRNAILQKELICNWKPPLGFPKDVSCEISFSVNAHGAAKNINIIKSSGIVMYDLSARNTLFAMKMPQWTYGKTLTINFTQ